MREYFLETDRIVFSHWTEDDEHLAHLVWGEEMVTRYISKTGKFTGQEIKDRLNMEISNEKQFNVQYWPIFDKETHELIGCCGLRPHDIDKCIYEIGFHVRGKYWGKGLGTESANAVMQYAFNHVNASALFAGHNPDNVNSKKVLEKLGFAYIGDEYYAPTGLYHPSYQCVRR